MHHLRFTRNNVITFCCKILPDTTCILKVFKSNTQGGREHLLLIINTIHGIPPVVVPYKIPLFTQLINILVCKIPLVVVLIGQ